MHYYEGPARLCTMDSSSAPIISISSNSEEEGPESFPQAVVLNTGAPQGSASSRSKENNSSGQALASEARTADSRGAPENHNEIPFPPCPGCGLPCEVRKVAKPTKNHGRPFFVCPRHGRWWTPSSFAGTPTRFSRPLFNMNYLCRRSPVQGLDWMGERGGD